MEFVPVALTEGAPTRDTAADTGAAFVRAPGVAVESLAGDDWVAFSALSGETHLINETIATIVALLDEHVPLDSREIARTLAEETGMPRCEVTALLADAWNMLVQSGLARRSDGPHSAEASR